MSAARLQAAQRPGAAREEVMETIWVAAEMRAGGAIGPFDDRACGHG